ncbi:MAG: AAA family ATPase, partial [Chloroflexi bacterium]|nr:AAA family ATPase [Chloroflexota bacterium]
DIAEILSEVREKLPDLEAPPTLQPEKARIRLLKNITNFLQNAAQSQPLMLVLDDLHWADRSSLLLLEFIAREIQSSPLLVLGTYRDVEVHRRHPLSETLGSLMREQGFLRVQLTGLAEGEVDQLIRKTGSDSLSPELSAAIHQRTEGNPLFVSEIIRMLPNDAIEEGRDYLTSIPEGVRDAIGTRLNRLSEGCNQVLTTASVIGREFDFKLLGSVVDNHTEASLLGLIDEALEAHVIEELPEGRERYQFSHTLVQETLAGELSASRKVRLHARIAEALETLYGSSAETHASELAFHFAEAESVVGPKKLVHYSLLAGERALGSYAYEEAITYFERALAAKERQPMDANTAALLFGLGRAKVATLEEYQVQDALEILKRAFDFYIEAGDATGAVAIAQSPALTRLYRHSSEAAAQLLARALVLVPPDSQAAGSLLSRYVATLGMQEADYSRAMEACSQGLAIAQKTQDTSLEMATTAQAAQVDRFHLHPRRGLEKSLRAIELASLVDEPQAEILVRGVAVGCSLVIGDLEGARVHAAAIL